MSKLSANFLLYAEVLSHEGDQVEDGLPIFSDLQHGASGLPLHVDLCDGFPTYHQVVDIADQMNVDSYRAAVDRQMQIDETQNFSPFGWIMHGDARKSRGLAHLKAQTRNLVSNVTIADILKVDQDALAQLGGADITLSDVIPVAKDLRVSIHVLSTPAEIVADEVENSAVPVAATVLSGIDLHFGRASSVNDGTVSQPRISATCDDELSSVSEGQS